MRTIFLTALAALIASCYVDEAPDRALPTSNTCRHDCNSDLECNQGIAQTCKYCNFGSCSTAKPPSQIVDAGVDAPDPTGL
jgi:hypothetical protein